MSPPTPPIKDPLIRQMKSLWELEDYIEKTEDAQLAMMVEIVKEYGNQIPYLIRMIKEKHIDNDDKDKAEMIFSTVHRCKGMEYDTVQIVNDRQRKTSNVRDYVFKLVGSLIELFFVGLNDMGNILLCFQYHTVVSIVSDSD